MPFSSKRRVIGSLFIVVLLVLALPGSVYLVQHRYQLISFAGGPNICTWETCQDDPAKWAAGAAAAEGKAQENPAVAEQVQEIINTASTDQKQVQHIEAVLNTNLNESEKQALGGILTDTQKQTLNNTLAPTTIAPTPTPIENICFLPGMNCVGDDWVFGVELAKKPANALKDNKNPALIAKLKEQILTDANFAKNNPYIVNAVIEKDPDYKNQATTSQTKPTEKDFVGIYCAVCGGFKADPTGGGCNDQAQAKIKDGSCFVEIAGVKTQAKDWETAIKNPKCVNPDNTLCAEINGIAQYGTTSDKNTGEILYRVSSFDYSSGGWAKISELNQQAQDQIKASNPTLFTTLIKPVVEKQIQNNEQLAKLAQDKLKQTPGVDEKIDKLSPEDQAKVNQMVKNVEDQNVKIKSIAEQCVDAEDICQKLIEKFNQADKDAVRKYTEQLTANKRAVEENRQKNIDIVAMQIAQVDRDTTLSDDQKSKEYERISNQFGTDSEAVKLATQKAGQINTAIDNYLKCEGNSCNTNQIAKLAPDVFNLKDLEKQRQQIVAQKIVNLYNEATKRDDYRLKPIEDAAGQNLANKYIRDTVIETAIKTDSQDQINSLTKQLIAEDNKDFSDPKVALLGLISDPQKKIELQNVIKVQNAQPVANLYKEYYQTGCQNTATTNKQDPNCLAIQKEIDKQNQKYGLSEEDLDNFKKAAANNYALALAQNTNESSKDVSRDLDIIAADIKDPKLIEKINETLISKGQFSYQQFQEFRDIKNNNLAVKILAMADPAGTTINDRIKQNVLITDPLQKQQNLKELESQVTDRMWALANPFKLFSEDQRQKSAEGAVLLTNYISAGAMRRGNDELNLGLKEGDALKVVRGAVIQGAVPAALAVTAVGAPVIAAVIPISIPAAVTLLSTTAGVANSVHSLENTAEACTSLKDASNYRCVLAAANSVFMIVSTGVGVAGGAPAYQAALKQGLLDTALKNGSTVGIEKLTQQAVNAQARSLIPPSTAFQRFTLATDFGGAVVFSANAREACFGELQPGQQRDALSCGSSLAMAGISGLRLTSRLVGGATSKLNIKPLAEGVGKLEKGTNIFDLGLNSTQTVAACGSVLIGKSADINSCTTNLAFATSAYRNVKSVHQLQQETAKPGQSSEKIAQKIAGGEKDLTAKLHEAIKAEALVKSRETFFLERDPKSIWQKPTDQQKTLQKVRNEFKTGKAQLFELENAYAAAEMSYKSPAERAKFIVELEAHIRVLEETQKLAIANTDSDLLLSLDSQLKQNRDLLSKAQNVLPTTASDTNVNLHLTQRELNNIEYQISQLEAQKATGQNVDETQLTNLRTRQQDLDTQVQNYEQQANKKFNSSLRGIASRVLELIPSLPSPIMEKVSARTTEEHTIKSLEPIYNSDGTWNLKTNSKNKAVIKKTNDVETQMKTLEQKLGITLRGQQAGEKNQVELVAKALLGNNSQLYKAVTGLGKGAVVIPMITVAKAQLENKPVLTLFQNAGKVKLYLKEIIKNKSAEIDRLDWQKPDETILKDLEQALSDKLGHKFVILTGDFDLRLADAGKNAITIATPDVIFNQLSDNSAAKNLMAHLEGGILVADEAHQTLLANTDYVVSQGQGIHLSGTHFEKIFMKTWNQIKGNIGDIQLTKDEHGRYVASEADLARLTSGMSADEIAAAKSIIDVYGKHKGIEIRENEGRPALAEQNNLTGRTPSNPYDALALEVVGRKVLGISVEPLLSQVTINPKSLSSNYGLFLRKFSQIIGLTGTPEQVTNQFRFVYGIDLHSTSLASDNFDPQQAILNRLNNPSATTTDNVHEIWAYGAVTQDELPKRIASATQVMVIVRYSDGHAEQYVNKQRIGNISLDEINTAIKRGNVLQIYEYGAHQGTDAKTQAGDKLRIFINSKTTMTEFIQAVGRGRNGGENLEIVWVGDNKPTNYVDMMALLNTNDVQATRLADLAALKRGVENLLPATIEQMRKFDLESFAAKDSQRAAAINKYYDELLMNQKANLESDSSLAREKISAWKDTAEALNRTRKLLADINRENNPVVGTKAKKYLESVLSKSKNNYDDTSLKANKGEIDRPISNIKNLDRLAQEAGRILWKESGSLALGDTQLTRGKSTVTTTANITTDQRPNAPPPAPVTTEANGQELAFSPKTWQQKLTNFALQPGPIARTIVTTFIPHIPLANQAFEEIGSQALERFGNFVGPKLEQRINTITQAFARPGLEGTQPETNKKPASADSLRGPNLSNLTSSITNSWNEFQIRNLVREVGLDQKTTDDLITKIKANPQGCGDCFPFVKDFLKQLATAKNLEEINALLDKVNPDNHQNKGLMTALQDQANNKLTILAQKLTVPPSQPSPAQGSLPNTRDIGFRIDDVGKDIQDTGIPRNEPAAQTTQLAECVVGNTLLKRRKRKKGKDVWEDVRIDQIQEGDEILSLDEATGRFVPAVVRKLLAKGVQNTWKLVTVSGKSIETTSEHPYLVRRSILGGTFQIDQSPRLETLAQDSFIAIANKNIQYVVKISKKDKLWLKNAYNRRNMSRFYGVDIFAQSVGLFLRTLGVQNAKIQIDRDYSGHEARINEIIRREVSDIQIEYISVGHRQNSYAHYAAYGAFLGKREVDMTIKIDRGALKGVGLGIVTHQDKSLTTGDTRGRLAKSYQPSLEMSSLARWRKVSELRPGIEIATIDGWETVASIQKMAREKVYDIEVENTHNFVGNGIVAHNTAILNAWNINSKTVPQEVQQILPDLIFDPGLSKPLAPLAGYDSKYGQPLQVYQSSHLSALVASGQKIWFTIDLQDMRSRNKVSHLNGDWYMRSVLHNVLDQLPAGTQIVRLTGDSYAFLYPKPGTIPNIEKTQTKSWIGKEFTSKVSEPHINTDPKVKPFIPTQIDRQTFANKHPEFLDLIEQMDDNLLAFLEHSFADPVISGAFHNFNHVLAHLKPDVEYTLRKRDTSLFVKVSNDIMGSAAGDNAIRTLANVSSQNIITVRDGASPYFITPKGEAVTFPGDSTFTLTYPDGTVVTYPLKFFVSSSNFTPSVESLNLAREATSDNIQRQLEAYIKDLPEDDLWLRNIYFNPHTSRGADNLRAAGKTETEIDELKTHYRSAGTNTETGKEAWVWKSDVGFKIYDIRNTVLIPAVAESLIGPTGQLILPYIAKNLISQTPTLEQTPSTGPPTAQNPNQLTFDFTPKLDLPSITDIENAIASIEKARDDALAARKQANADIISYLRNIVNAFPVFAKPNEPKPVIAPPSAASVKTVFQEAVESSSPVLGPAANVVTFTLELANKKPVSQPQQTSPKQNITQQAVTNKPAADESQPTTTTTANPARRAIAPKISQPTSKFDDFVKRVEEAFPAPKEQPKLSSEQLKLLAKYQQSLEYARYLLGLSKIPVPQPEEATPKVIEEAKAEVVNEVAKKVENPLFEFPTLIDQINAQNALIREWQKILDERKAPVEQQKIDEEAGQKLADEIYRDYLASQAEVSAIPSNNNWFILAVLNNFQNNVSDHLLPKDKPLTMDDFKDFLSAQRFVLTGEYPRITNVESKLPSHRINLDTILVTRNQENILKENVTDPDGPILTLLRTGKPARRAIEKSLLAGTTLKPADIIQVANETEVALNEAMNRIYIEYVNTHLANLPTDNPWAYQIAVSPLPQYVAHQNAIRALEAQKLKEAEEAAQLTEFLVKFNYDRLKTNQSLLPYLSERLVKPISIRAEVEKAWALKEDTDRFRKQLEDEAKKPVISFSPTETLDIADVVYRTSVSHRAVLDLLKAGIEARYTPAPTIDFLADRREPITEPIKEYVAELLQDFEAQRQAIEQSQLPTLSEMIPDFIPEAVRDVLSNALGGYSYDALIALANNVNQIKPIRNQVRLSGQYAKILFDTIVFATVDTTPQNIVSYINNYMKAVDINNLPLEFYDVKTVTTLLKDHNQELVDRLKNVGFEDGDITEFLVKSLASDLHALILENNIYSQKLDEFETAVENDSAIHKIIQENSSDIEAKKLLAARAREIANETEFAKVANSALIGFGKNIDSVIKNVLEFNFEAIKKQSTKISKIPNETLSEDDNENVKKISLANFDEVRNIEVLSKLGEGYEGSVYLIRGKNPQNQVKMYAIKIQKFGNIQNETLNAVYLNAVEQKGAYSNAKDSTYVGRHLGYDENIKARLMDYVKGVSVVEYLNSPGPISKKIAAIIQIAHFQYLISQEGWGNPDSKIENYVIDESGKLHVLDIGLYNKNGGPSSQSLIRLNILQALSIFAKNQDVVLKFDNLLRSHTVNDLNKREKFELWNLINSEEFNSLPVFYRYEILNSFGLLKNSNNVDLFSSDSYKNRLNDILAWAKTQNISTGDVPVPLRFLFDEIDPKSQLAKTNNYVVIDLPTSDQLDSVEKLALDLEFIEKYREPNLVYLFLDDVITTNLLNGGVFMDTRLIKNYGVESMDSLISVANSIDPTVLTNTSSYDRKNLFLVRWWYKNIWDFRNSTINIMRLAEKNKIESKFKSGEIDEFDHETFLSKIDNGEYFGSDKIPSKLSLAVSKLSDIYPDLKEEILSGSKEMDLLSVEKIIRSIFQVENEWLPQDQKITESEIAKQIEILKKQLGGNEDSQNIQSAPQPPIKPTNDSNVIIENGTHEDVEKFIVRLSQETGSTWPEVNHKDTDQYLILKDKGGRIIGFAKYSEYLVSTKGIYLDLLIIDPKYQKNGLGTKLIQHLQNDPNISQIELEAKPYGPGDKISREDLKNFYIKLGFKEKTPLKYHLIWNKNGLEIRTDVSKFSDQIDQIVTNVRNRLVALQARAAYQGKLKTLASALYPDVARTLEDQRNQETIRNLSLDPELMRNINSDAILKIVNGDVRLAAIIENNLRTAKPLWDFMIKNNVSISIPFDDWLKIAENFNKFKFVYDGQLRLDSIRRAALFDVRTNILGTTINTDLENALANKYTTEYLNNMANGARRNLLAIRQNMSNQEVVDILKTLREDPILGILMVEKAVSEQAVKNTAKQAEDAVQAEVSTKKPKPQVAKPSSLAQKLLDLISSPTMRRNALLTITTISVVSVAIITAIQGYISQPVAQPADQFVPHYVARPDERNIGPIEVPIVIENPKIEPVQIAKTLVELSKEKLDNGCFAIHQVKMNDKDIPLVNVISYPDKNPQDLNEYCNKNIKFFKEIGLGKARIDQSRINIFNTDKGKVAMLRQESLTCFLFSSAIGFEIFYQQIDNNNIPTIFDLSLLPELTDIPFDQYDAEYNKLLQDEFMIGSFISDVTLKEDLLKNPKLIQQNISDPRLTKLKTAAMLSVVNVYIQKDKSFATFLSKIGIEWRNKEIEQLTREDPFAPGKFASNAKKQLLLDNINDDMKDNNLIYLGLTSGPLSAHSYVVGGIRQIEGKTYLHLFEPNAAPTGPASWGHYKDIQRLPDNSILLSIDDAVNNYIGYKIMSRNPAGQALLQQKSVPTKPNTTIGQNLPKKISATGNPQTKINFTSDIKLLPPETYTNTYNPAKLIRPTTVVIHYANNAHPDGTPLPPETWTTSSIYNGLLAAKSSSHFGIGFDGTVTQYLPMTENMVQKSFAAGGDANEYTINIEMGGNKPYFEKLMVPDKETDATIDLVVNLMIQYNIRFDAIIGHQDVKYTNGFVNSKIDPTPQYMQFFQKRLSERINTLGYDLGQPKSIAMNPSGGLPASALP